ncbi:RNA-directed DNA polymerase, eukaryota, Reverse transcriptase zinc-binding domain protein [Artemisia annua]|uniref:RNA-directed DNA polymerase, eukaryota, Reverse transcriptase zinc-binding domain protein n=1 Tax=Artemisia annua TaxID=35608 RepID=A0A2U1LWP9_ARTAN|nr:RNA-directed DNA polymerase, eukaryota, Reverse transcriptase zinc-binding domain protein [Artemisia annua]
MVIMGRVTRRVKPKTIATSNSNEVKFDSSISDPAFDVAIIDEERFLKQRAKVEWLRVGDSNSSYFHKLVNNRVATDRIDMVLDSNGVCHESSDVQGTFVSHYSHFLGNSGITSNLDTHDLFSNRRSKMLSMGDDKSLGLDGFTTAFFKGALDVIGGDVYNSVKVFFVSGKLLKEVNHTIIALIPKISTPTRVTDYRSISHYNFLFKCTSKIIWNRIKYSLSNLGHPRCAFKVNIQKAYDTVDWVFLREILTGFGFHECMVAWIRDCVSSTSFYISLNGSLHGMFKGRRGLRQGDPLSPYLFTLVLTLILKVRKIFWYKIGNGSNIFTWFDNWGPNCPIRDVVTVRDINRAGFGVQSSLTLCSRVYFWKEKLFAFCLYDIKGDKFRWIRGEEFRQQIVAGLNLMSITLSMARLWVKMSTLPPTVKILFGLFTSFFYYLTNLAGFCKLVQNKSVIMVLYVVDRNW